MYHISVFLKLMYSMKGMFKLSLGFADGLLIPVGTAKEYEELGKGLKKANKYRPIMNRRAGES